MTFEEELLSIYKPDFGRVIVSHWRKRGEYHISFYDAGTRIFEEEGTDLDEIKERILNRARNRRRSSADLLA